MNEEYQYQCQSCSVVGELDEYYEQFECPQCGGAMLPLNARNEPAPYQLDEDATIAIPRDGLQTDMSADIKVAQAVDLGFGGMLTTSVATGKHQPFSGAKPVAQQSRVAPQMETPPPAPVAPQQPVAPSTPIERKPPMKGKIVNSRSQKKAFSMGKKPAAANVAPAPQPVTQASSTATEVPTVDVASQPPPQPLSQQATPPQKAKKQGFQIKKKGSSVHKFGKKKSAPRPAPAVPAQQPAPQPEPEVEIQEIPQPEAPQNAVANDEASTRSDLTPIQPNDVVVQQQPELESAATDQAAKFAALQAELAAAHAAREEIEKNAAENVKRIAEETARKTAEEVRRVADETARKAAEEEKKVAEEAARRAVEEAKRSAEEAARKVFEEERKNAEEAARKAAEEAAIKVEEARREAELKAKEAVEQAKQEAIKAAEEKMKQEREEFEKQRRELQEHRELAEKTAIASAALATATAAKLEDEKKQDLVDDKKDDKADKDKKEEKLSGNADSDGKSEKIKGNDTKEEKSEEDKKDKKIADKLDKDKKSDIDSEQDKSDDKKDDKADKDKKDGESETTDGKDGEKKNKTLKPKPFGKRPPFGGKNSQKGKGLAQLPRSKKKKKRDAGDSEDKGENDVEKKVEKEDISSTTKTELDVPVSKDKAKSGKKSKRPLGKNGKTLPRKGTAKPAGTKTKLAMEEELHPELVKIHKKKRMVVQCLVSTILIIIGVFVVYGIKWYKQHPTATPKNIDIPKRVVDIVPPKSSVATTSSLDGEFNSLRRKVRKMPSKSLEGINAKIKVWQEFLDKNEKDHPDDPKIAKANALIHYLEGLKAYY